jgi:regulator of sirC expression with transglutaminase-like and TPR domain
VSASLLTQFRQAPSVGEDNLDHAGGAIADYRRFLELAPDEEDAPSVRARLIRLQSQPSDLH